MTPMRTAMINRPLPFVFLLAFILFVMQGCDNEKQPATRKKAVESKPLVAAPPTKDASENKANQNNKDTKTTQVGKAGDQPKDGGKQPTKDANDPTANAKALKDPNIEPTFVDPNNPNFIPPDRQFVANFELNDLKRISLEAGQEVEAVQPVWSLVSYVPGLSEPAHGAGNFGRGYLELPFMLLAGYDYPTNLFVEAKPKEGEPVKPKPQIPYKIKSLNMQNVAIKGYMMPIDFEDGGTNEFILSRVIPSCFYCQPPQLNDWVEVRIKGGKRVPYYPDSAIIVYGQFEVGEMLEDGFVVNLYRVEAVKVDEVVEP